MSKIKRIFLIASIAFGSCSDPVKNEIEKDEYFIGLNTADDEHPDLTTIELTKKRISEVNLFKADDTIILNSSDDYCCHYKLVSKFNRISKQGDTLNCAIAYIKETDLKLKDSVNLGFFLKAICKTNNLYELDLFSDMSSYYEYIKNDAPTKEQDITIKHERIKRGYVGKLRQGIFYYYH